MGVFYILLLVPIMMQHIVVKQSHIDYTKRNKYSLTFFFIFFTALVMLRHESVGNDTRNYRLFFRHFAEMDWAKVGKDSFEIGFAYFNKLISVFTKEPQLFLAITAIITVTMIYQTYKRLCVDTALTIVLFCIMSTFVMLFSGIRQMLAVGIGFAAYEFTRKNKLFPFILMVFLAMTFHTSAFMLAFMYPVYHAKITKKWLIAVIPAATVVFVFNKQIFSFLALLIERYTGYDASITQTGAYTMIILFALFAVIAFVIPNESRLDAETVGLRNFLLLTFVLQMFAPLHTIAMRMNYYYIIFIPILLPKIIEYRNERWKQVAIVGRHVMVIFFLIYFFFSKANNGGNLHVFPYHFFWEAI